MHLTMFISRRIKKENKRLRQELAETRESFSTVIADQNALIDGLREKLRLSGEEREGKEVTRSPKSPRSIINRLEETIGPNSLVDVSDMPPLINHEKIFSPHPLSRKISSLSVASFTCSETEDSREFLLVTPKKRVRSSRLSLTSLLPTTPEICIDEDEDQETLSEDHEPSLEDLTANSDHLPCSLATSHTSGWSNQPLLPMSPIARRPRRIRVSSKSLLAKQLPREQHIQQELSSSQLSTSKGPSTIEIRNHRILDASNEKGLYSGSIDRNTLLPEGYGGSMKYSDGRYYKGLWSGGQWHGLGKLKYSNGDIFYGNFFRNKREGKGVLQYSNRDKFDGRFENDEMREGTFEYSTGSVYEGLFWQGKRHGFGKNTFSNGSVYEGQWKEDTMHGHGRVDLQDGSFYNGGWKSGFAHGKGTEVGPGGMIQFEGRWKRGKRVCENENDRLAQLRI